MRSLPVKVSVIVPVYNVEKYLSTCLLSCINQTLHDIEILCVNDGSTDHSMIILQQFAKKDHRIQIIDKPNGGLSSARNAGLAQARGKIIMFLDSDDYFALNACERVWREMLEAPTDIVTFGTNIFPEIPHASDWYYDLLRIKTHRHTKFIPEVLFQEKGAKPFVWRQAFSRMFLEKKGLQFDETVQFGEDTVFQMEAFPHADNFSFISDSLYYYRWYREGSLMSRMNEDLDEKIENHLFFIDIICAYWLKQGWLEQYGSEFVTWLLEFLIPDIRDQTVKRAPEHLKKLNRIIYKYGLEEYLKKVPRSSRSLIRTLKRVK